MFKTKNIKQIVNILLCSLIWAKEPVFLYSITDPITHNIKVTRLLMQLCTVEWNNFYNLLMF